MPPKKKAPDAGKPDKAKAKVVDDKTFGLKNKKGKKQQTYIKNVASQVQGTAKKAEAAPKLSKREQERLKLEELNELFKPVQKAQTVAVGVDPKSVLCSFFKQGLCHKGTRCKFSHDLSIERKSEKRSLYDDGQEEKKEENMNDWDQETLEDVVKQKHGSTNTNKTGIICKYFLDAVEKNLYGWFWNCPNGEKCMYRHALPPGFVLKRDQKKDDEADKISLEEHIENERNQLSGSLTPVTKETFLAWKKRKIEEKKELHNQDMSRKKEEFKKGGLLKISGKEVFLFKPELADADDEEADDEIYTYTNEDEADDDEPCMEINLDVFAAEIDESVDISRVTGVSTLLPRDRETANAPTSGASLQDSTVAEEYETDHADVNGVDQACASNTNSADVVIDESLFEDLDDLDLEDGD